MRSEVIQRDSPGFAPPSAFATASRARSVLTSGMAGTVPGGFARQTP